MTPRLFEVRKTSLRPLPSFHFSRGLFVIIFLFSDKNMYHKSKILFFLALKKLKRFAVINSVLLAILLIRRNIFRKNLMFLGVLFAKINSAVFSSRSFFFSISFCHISFCHKMTEDKGHYIINNCRSFIINTIVFLRNFIFTNLRHFSK